MVNSRGKAFELMELTPERIEEKKRESAKVTKIFSDMCTRLTKSLVQKRTIHERTLFDFNKMVICIVNGKIEELPDAFDELENHVSDYWHYELENENDLNRQYSYIRLYQSINTINTFYIEQKLQQKACLERDKNRENINVIYWIHKYPGITHKKLREALNISNEDLQSQLCSLEEKGFLLGQRSGDERYYLLSNAGDVLYRTLRTEHTTADSYWSFERTQILIDFLQLLFEKYEKRVPVLESVQLIAQLDHVSITEYFRNKKLKRYSLDDLTCERVINRMLGADLNRCLSQENENTWDKLQSSRKSKYIMDNEKCLERENARREKFSTSIGNKR